MPIRTFALPALVWSSLFRSSLYWSSLGLAVSGAALAQEKTLNVYNWNDYIDTRVLDDFTKETGIKVTYDTYESNETLEAKLLAGKTGYDIVVPSATFMQRQIQAGILRKLDKTKLPNLKNVAADIAAKLAFYDPGNQYAANYMWITTGIAYNVKKARERLGDAPIDSWDIVFKPENLKKFANCGIFFLDSPEDIFTSALKFLKLDPNSKNLKDIERAAATLEAIRPYVKKFQSGEIITALANGDICLAVTWSGDAFQARNRAVEARNGIEINYVIPREGALLSLDNLAIPADAPHVDEAHAFIDFMLRPDIAARNSNVTNYANGVSASKPLVKDEVRNNPTIWPDALTLTRLFTISPFDQKTQRVVTRAWTKFKTGQ